VNVNSTASATAFASCFLAFASSEGRACGFVSLPPTAVVDTGRSSIDADLEVRIDGSGDDASCSALLEIPLSKLPSRSVIPRPRELASELIPVARSYGATICQLVVWVLDDTETAGDVDGDSDACWSGSFRYDSDFWRVETEDAPCW